MKIGIIGGSGLYNLEGMEGVEFLDIATPFGAPADAYAHGTLGGREVYFLPRHGRGHRLLPSEINHRANIYGFKMLGVERIVSVSAVGSLKEEYRPRDVVLPDQYFDRTKQSLSHTFFGNGLVAHVAFGDPACEDLRALLADSARRAAGESVRVHVGGTYVNMEGPAFSTRAESNAYRAMGFDIIGMTSLPEAKLCREAELCYQAMAMVTDYDCWHETEEDVTVDAVVAHLMANTKLAKEVLRDLIPRIPEGRTCPCAAALATAVLTSREAISEETRHRLRALVGKYLS